MALPGNWRGADGHRSEGLIRAWSLEDLGEEHTIPRWMCDRPGAWPQDAVLKMGPILLGAPSALAMLHEGPWFGLEPDRI